MRQKLTEELEFCLRLWKEKGSCQFGGHTNCSECAAPYILLKLINGEVLHGDMKRLTLNDWEGKLQQLKKQA